MNPEVDDDTARSDFLARYFSDAKQSKTGEAWVQRNAAKNRDGEGFRER